MDSPLLVAAFTPSNTLACRTAAKLLLISGRLSRAVRAASAELLESGMKPTFFRTSGTRKCKCRQRVETPRIATSSTFTPMYLAMRSPRDGREICADEAASACKVSARRSSSDTRLVAMVILGEFSFEGRGETKGSVG